VGDVLFAGVPVREFAEAVAWYSHLFGRAPDVEAHAEEVMWRVSDGGWVYVLRDPARAGHAVVSIAVADLDSSIEDLATRGLSGAVEPVGDAGRKATLLDPDGNQVSLLEVTEP
jgi:predicted enzyme related to lactoylglutathione lyase